MVVDEVKQVNNFRNKSLTHKAQSLRKNMTKEEKRLWYDFLKKLPLKFNRQKVINNYIVDFICAEVKLIIEVDGEQHYNDIVNRLEDEKRDQFFNSIGLKVLRISNRDVNKNFESVCLEILKNLPRECAEKMYGKMFAENLFFKF